MTYRVGGPSVAWRETGDEIVVLDIVGSAYFGLNRPAAQLWKRLTAGASCADLTAALMATASVGQERAWADVGTFLAELGRYGLLQQDAAE